MVKTTFYKTIILNPKTLILEFQTPINKIYLDKYHLKKVEVTSNETINLGDKINVTFNMVANSYNTYYYANYMYKENALSIRINEFEENDSSIYILPLIGLKSQHLLIGKNFVSCYIQHYDFKHSLGEYLYLIYRYFPVNYYAGFINAIQKQEGCISHQRDKDQRFDCFVFKIREHFIKDIKLILNGKFSKISKEAKLLILNFHNQRNSETPLYQILFKGQLRKNELEEHLGVILPNDIDYAEKPNMLNEIWNYSK